MSAQTVFLLNDPNFKTKGPVLNGPYRYSLGWMRPSSVHAVAVSGGKVVESSVDLAPLNAAVSSNPRLIRIDLPWGPLGAKTVFVEYRTKGGWDGAIPKDVVLVHDFMNQVSYLRAVLDPPSRRLEVFGLHVIREDVYVDQAYDLRIAVRGLNAATGTITIEISTIPFVQLVGKITTESRSTVSTGVYHFPSGGPTGEMICGQAEFAYSRVLQEQKATYQVQATGFKDGPELEWSINTAELVGLQGQVSARVSRTAPMPPPGGITTNNYSALIDYQITGNTITLKNKPSDGMYTILLGVKATDSSGREASWHLPLTFLGDVLSFGPEYNKHMALCLAKTKARTAELVDIPRRLVKEWNPSPISQKVRAQVDRIFALAAAAEKSEPELASALLTAASQVYKVSFRTAGLPELKIRNKRERKRR
jgi:hypothetical protein